MLNGVVTVKAVWITIRWCSRGAIWSRANGGERQNAAGRVRVLHRRRVGC